VALRKGRSFVPKWTGNGIGVTIAIKISKNGAFAKKFI
jgi:hypothetical protein